MSTYNVSEDVFFNSDLNDFFPHSTWPEMDPVPTWDTRPDSRQSVTPVSTPTPSVPGYSPAAAPICPSPLHAYSAGVASPVTHNKSFSSGSSSQPGGHSSPSPLSAHFSTSAATAGHSSPSPLSSHFNQNTTSPSPAAQNPSTPSAHQFSNAFSFGQCESPFGIDPPPSADTKPEITPEVNNHDSERLRNLLTNKRSQLTNNNSNTSSNMMQKHLSNQNQQKSMMHQSNKDGSDLPRNSMDKSGHESQEIKNNNRILKGLLNQEDEEDKCDNSLQQPLLPPPRPRAQQTQDNKSGNHMLLRVSILYQVLVLNFYSKKNKRCSLFIELCCEHSIFQLLNEKSDDDDPDTKVNRNNSELRTQLLKQVYATIYVFTFLFTKGYYRLVFNIAFYFYRIMMIQVKILVIMMKFLVFWVCRVLPMTIFQDHGKDIRLILMNMQSLSDQQTHKYVNLLTICIYKYLFICIY